MTTKNSNPNTLLYRVTKNDKDFFYDIVEKIDTFLLRNHRYNNQYDRGYHWCKGCGRFRTDYPVCPECGTRTRKTPKCNHTRKQRVMRKRFVEY